MINRFPLWKNLLIVLAIVLAFIYAAPNLYPNDPAIQITHDSGVVTETVLTLAREALDAENIEYFGEEINSSGNAALIRLRDESLQSRAQQLISASLTQDYIVALNLAPTTPDWLRSLGAGPLTLGLDLSGGVHFLMEVDMESAVNKRLNDSLATMRTILREERLRYRRPLSVDSQNRIVIRFQDAETRTQASRAIREDFPDLVYSTEQRGQDFLLLMNYSELQIQELQDYALQQNLTTLRQRVNELGVKEPLVAPIGTSRIIIELPGIQDTAQAKALISAVATLEVYMQPDQDTDDADISQYEYEGVLLDVNNDIVVAGENVIDARSTYDQNGLPVVQITLDSPGASRMNDATLRRVNRMMGIVLIESHVATIHTLMPSGEIVTRNETTEERRMISWARISQPLGKQFIITGLDQKEANDLALLIRSGALAAPMYFLEESTVGPSLGQENIDKGVLSIQIGMGVVVLFMLLWYRGCGIAANIALGVNLVLMVALMSVIGFTLTMPGIAGIVLTVGMAVDANVLIFARIREELKVGSSVQRAIDSGFDRAFTTIMDANITTLLVGVILWSIGTGPVRGFAVTLTLGILTSMFTAIVVTRAIINAVFGGRNLKSLSIGLAARKYGSMAPLARSATEQAAS